MILRGSQQELKFIEDINSRICGERRAVRLPRPDDDLVYFGAGYWRGVLVLADDGKVRGVRLINPDRTPAEINAVERGIAVLLFTEVE